MAASSTAVPIEHKRFFERRAFETYPSAAQRWTVVALTTLSMVIVYYEFQLAPVLPLLLPYLHLSHVAYGNFTALLYIGTVITALYGGPLADRYGRVIVIKGCLTAMIVLTFLNLMITGIPSFLIIRSAMGLVGGLIVAAAWGLIRDMTPRSGRALGFAVVMSGTYASNTLANFVASVTLPIYHTWQSQFWILGIFALAMYVPIVVGLRDLAPALRLQIRTDQTTTVQARGSEHGALELPRSTVEAYRRLLRYPLIWLMVPFCFCGATLNIVIQAYGPLMFSEVFRYSPADAARMTAYFWTAVMGTLLVVGYLSDRLQVRKGFVIAGALGAGVVLALWVPSFAHPLSYRTTALICVALGILHSSVVESFVVFYSVAVEDFSPALQATGWSFFHGYSRLFQAIASSVIMLLGVKYGWPVPLWLCSGGSFLLALGMLPVRSR